MKQISLILLLKIYALATFGVGINHFYCCGKLKSSDISFVQQGTEKCAKGDQTDGCCKTEYQSVKVKDSHVVAEEMTVPAKHFNDVHIFHSSTAFAELINSPQNIANSSHAPPFSRSVPAYILNCIYRI